MYLTAQKGSTLSFFVRNKEVTLTALGPGRIHVARQARHKPPMRLPADMRALQRFVEVAYQFALVLGQAKLKPGTLAGQSVLYAPVKAGAFAVVRSSKPPANGSYDLVMLMASSEPNAAPRPGAAPAGARDAVRSVVADILRIHKDLHAFLTRNTTRNVYPLPEPLGPWLPLPAPAGGAARRLPAQVSGSAPTPPPFKNTPMTNLNGTFVYGLGITQLEPLGQGGFGAVFAVNTGNVNPDILAALVHRVPAAPRLPATPTPNAVVKLQKLDLGPALKRDLNRAIREVKTLQQLGPTGVVPRLYASGYDAARGVHVTLMERVQGVTLLEYTRTRPLTARLFTKIEKAVVTLWKHGVAHVDLNPANIMITPDDRVVIIDFGLARRLPADLVPASTANALNAEYQNRLAKHLVANRAAAGHRRAAMNTHILRWLYWQVPNKAGVPKLRGPVAGKTKSGGGSSGGAHPVLDLQTGATYASVAEAARQLGIGESTLRTWVNDPENLRFVVMK